MKDFVTRQNHTNFVVLNVSYRHDLQESSSVNSTVKSFNGKLMKYSKAFDNLHLLQVENCQEKNVPYLEGTGDTRQVNNERGRGDFKLDNQIEPKQK
jgi:hypothetical protein